MSEKNRNFKIRALGEIAIRCDDVDRMAAFYGDVLGLERMTGSSAPGITFFRIGEGFGGHTQILALFDKGYMSRPGLHQTALRPRKRATDHPCTTSHSACPSTSKRP